jgi:hypothetical protein
MQPRIKILVGSVSPVPRKAGHVDGIERRQIMVFIATNPRRNLAPASDHHSATLNHRQAAPWSRLATA